MLFTEGVVYEIVKYLNDKDFKNIRLVFKNIHDDHIRSLYRYIRRLIDRNEIGNPLIEHYRWHPDVLKMYYDCKEKIDICYIATTTPIYSYTFEKILDNLAIGDVVKYKKYGKTKIDKITSISSSCINCRSRNSSRLTNNFSIHISFKIYFKKIANIEINIRYKQDGEYMDYIIRKNSTTYSIDM
jgi:hypothetical protein